MAHAATQGIIPDLVPEDKRGRFSGVKAMLELPLPLIVVSFTIGKMVSAGNMWGALAVGMAVIVAVMLITMLIPEKRPEGAAPPLDWKPFIRLVLMTVVFTLIILGSGKVVQSFSALLNPDSTPTALFLSMGCLDCWGWHLQMGSACV